jgi:hypothetical protein
LPRLLWRTCSRIRATRRLYTRFLGELANARPFFLGCSVLRFLRSPNHTITLEISRDTQAAQDAVDRELVAHYRPGQPRTGLLVQLVERVGHLQNIAARSRHDLVFAPLSAVAKRITFPIDIWRLANPRWQELGYASLSAYITALIRYDLLVGGPHASTTADCRSKLQRKLTRKTLADRRKGRRRKILLDHLIERRAGRPVPQEELERVKASIAQELRRISLAR